MTDSERKRIVELHTKYFSASARGPVHIARFQSGRSVDGLMCWLMDLYDWLNPFAPVGVAVGSPEAFTSVEGKPRQKVLLTTGNVSDTSEEIAELIVLLINSAPELIGSADISHEAD